MVEFIARETKKILFKCCDRYATSNKKKLDEIQLILSLNLNSTDEIDLNNYEICEMYKKKQSLTIWEVLNVRPFLDFLGYSKLAPPFIYKALNRFAEKYKIELDKVSILCQSSLDERKKPEVHLALYNGYQFITEVLFYPREDENGDIIDADAEYLFNDQDFEMPKE
jgi:hypothetical protein